MFLMTLAGAESLFAYQKWVRYDNTRFGYSVEYPNIFSTRQQSENGDGIWLKSKQYNLTLSGGFNVLMQDGHAMLALRDVKNVLKKESGSSWFRLIHKESKYIIYEYGIMDDDTWASFTFTYPETKDFKTTIKRIEQSFRLGN